jgi:predicted TIM-barrel fold metal-dependent hydrolase
MKNILSSVLLVLVGCSTPKSIQSNPENEHAYGTDFHMHIHSPPKEYDDLQFNAERALFAADSIGLKRALVLSNAYSKNASQKYAETENDFIKSEVSKNKTRLAGACAVNPQNNWAWKEIKRCSSIGLKVLKLHFMASGLDLRKEKDYEIAKAELKNAELFNFTVIVHANYPRATRGNEIDKLKQLIEEFPKIRWIIGHLFGREFEELKGLNHPNYFVEISVVPIWMKTEEQRQKLVQTMRSVGMEKFIFGSDWPVIHPAETLKAFNLLPLTEKEKEMVLFTNASQFNDLFQ